MKKFLKSIVDGIKDFLYYSVDYLIMIAIVIAVSLIIAWRINILFDDKILDDPIESSQEVKDPIEDTEEEKPKEDTPETEDTVEVEDPVESTEEVDEPIEETEDLVFNIDDENFDDAKRGDIINVKIPEDFTPSTIAQLLKDYKLIKSRTEFLTKTTEMNLDTEFTSGEFTIQKGSALEDIIKRLTK